jgi:hypothetical protein
MMSCCVTSTQKIFKLKEEIPEDEISSMVKASFLPDERINISQALKYISCK